MPIRAQKEHRWLHKLIGDWSYEGECVMGPDRPRAKFKGTETVRALGDLWVVGESEGKQPDGSPGKSMITLGYDPKAKRYTGTWVGSMMTQVWIYDGTMDAGGSVLTLNSEGPSMSGKDKTAKYQDIVEVTDDDHRILRARVQGDDGTWNEFMTSHYRRK